MMNRIGLEEQDAMSILTLWGRVRGRDGKKGGLFLPAKDGGEGVKAMFAFWKKPERAFGKQIDISG